ncbi:MAG TPA: pantoate--beta-alanine ligase [Arsenicitalea sp.]|jgi:pantoate--beta-alanine ligase|nr:pantoate--beta-alanine ligase [Arsenicitalea sp.]
MITILRGIAELRDWRKALPHDVSVGLVPTMGALHAGHISLVDLSRGRCDVTIASIFVNPLQFGPNEDLAKYPRPLDDDLALLESAGCDAVFLPSVEDLYPAGASTYVVEESVSLPLCGAFRPGHFRGVATIVLKLFNLVQPTRGFFGQKDAQQCAVIERMVRDLNVPVEVVRGAIIRETDGLAMSSRNVYLSPEERRLAPLIRQSILAASNAYAAGERDAARLTEIGRLLLERKPAFSVQYWDVRDPDSLEALSLIGDKGALIAVAAYLGKTRLIDNQLL